MIEDRFNLDSFIEKKIPQLIEVFVKFYGESERERITKLFNNTTYAGYLREDDYSSIVSDIKNNAAKASADFFLSSINLEVNDENRKRFFGNNGFGGFTDYLKDFFNNYGGTKVWQVRSVLNSISKLYGIDSLTVDDPLYQQYCDELVAYKEAYEKTKEYYDSYLAKYQKYLDVRQSIDELNEKLTNKYMIKYLQELEPYLSDADKKIILTGKPYEFECYNVLLSYKYYTKTLIDAFSEESERKLNDPDVMDYEKNSIIDDRIEYFKKMGLDLGDDYQDYMNYDKIDRYLPSKEFVERVLETRERLKNEQDAEQLELLPNIEHIGKKIREANLFNLNNGFPRAIKKGTTAVSPNVREENGELVLHPILYFSGSTPVDCFDCRLIHELNHIYELSFDGYDGEEVFYRSGWDLVEEKACKTEEEVANYQEDEEHREYELLNEIINELLAQDISKMMHRDGIYLMGNEQISKDTSYTSYQYAARLVFSFYHDFFDEIVASRKNHNMDILFQRVGEENFMALNELVHEYLEYFVGFKFVNTMSVRAEGKTNESTEYYDRCIKESKEILERMRNYKIEDSFRL